MKQSIFWFSLYGVAVAPLPFELAVGCGDVVALRCPRNPDQYALRDILTGAGLQFGGAEGPVISIVRCSAQRPFGSVDDKIARLELAYERRRAEVVEFFAPGVRDTSLIREIDEFDNPDADVNHAIYLFRWVVMDRAALPQNVENAIVVHRARWQECVFAKLLRRGAGRMARSIQLQPRPRGGVAGPVRLNFLNNTCSDYNNLRGLEPGEVDRLEEAFASARVFLQEFDAARVMSFYQMQRNQMMLGNLKPPESQRIEDSHQIILFTSCVQNGIEKA